MAGAGVTGPAGSPERTETVAPHAHVERGFEVRFTPGTLVAGRYRIVALLGRGGMGEVYRADDTRLGQAVALKFLPPALASDRNRLARLVDEVRIGRQISHPNVCRLYDLTEAEGHRFLVMEYVDGEDLASLLRRIGRLPGDKALEIARHVCAGLAAAHDRGVIHRDLKPANVMIDGHGHARIADFGVATLADQVAGGEIVGTPAYMSPEQLAGERSSRRSDVFALGLVLYETFTGRRPFDASSVEELKALHAGAKPSPVSGFGRDVEPAVAQLIQRCLARDPAQRPESARVVLAGLPGGDPLQAALIAGQTPSPQMVAAASKVGDLHPRLAWVCLAAGLAGIFMVFWLGERVSLRRFIAPPMAPAALEMRARAVLDRLGYREPAVDAALGFAVDRDLIAYLKERVRSSGGWEQLRTMRPGPLVASYRESPHPLVATSWRTTAPWDLPALGRVGRGRPPLDVAGMTETVLDTSGRLVSFVAVPPRFETGSGPWGEVDWSVPLAEAGLAEARLRPCAPRWTAPVDTDRKAAWDGVNPDQPRTPLHVEAAAFHGRPVYFEVQGPWRRPTPVVDRPRAPFTAVAVTALVLNALILVGCAALARRNLQLGRGDRRGATRIALFASASVSVAQLLLADHTTDVFAEHNLVFLIVAQGVYAGLFLWALYLALEPAVRRRWPYALVSWTRLLSGRLRDPLVGRDVLVGLLSGLAVVIMLQLALLSPAWLGGALRVPRIGALQALADERQTAHVFAYAAAMATVQAMTVLFNFYLFYAWLRRFWLAALLLFVEFALLFTAGAEDVLSAPFVAVMLSASLVGVLVRFGLLALTALWFTFLVLLNVPLTLDWREWYAGRAFAVMAFFGLALVAAAYGSLGGKPPFGRALFEDEP
jgi:eukaryotic-like serine/threonine-protein kinase